MTSTQHNIEADAIVIGGGFGGCSALYELRKLGLKVKLLEAGSNFGGVWYWNRYPGARVDSEYSIYQFSHHDVWKNWDWKERFPGHEELREYFDHVDKTFDLRKDAVFNTTVTQVTYNNDTKTWTCKTEDGRLATSQYLILATGSSYKKYLPKYPNLSKFKGQIIHPAEFPKDLDVSGKKVGIIGQGATGIQIVQELAKKDCKLSVFVRTASFTMPMMQRKVAPDEIAAMKGFYGAIFDRTRVSQASEAMNPAYHSFNDVKDENLRSELYEELYRRGGWAFLSAWEDGMFNKEANAHQYRWWVKRTRSRMTDTAKMEIVAPSKQPAWLGTKRPSLEQDYYEMIDQPNVELIDVKERPIQTFTENGIISGSGSDEHFSELDILISATGFDAVTGSISDMNLHDKNGVRITDKWQASGIRTHLGVMIPEVPNVFAIYGPQSPTALANGPPFLEKQVNWITGMIKKMRQENINHIEVKQEAAEQYNVINTEVCNATLFHETPSWYFGSNVEGKRQEPLIWFGGVPYWGQLAEESAQSWDNYHIE